MDERSASVPQVRSQWSNRILILSLLGIACLTFFPFRIDFASPQSRTTSPFLLGPSLKQGEYRDFFLNVLLFVPFGFGVSAVLRKRGVSKDRGVLLTLAAGAITSYGVEVLQFYMPTRNSAWDDIASNTLGAVFGFLVFGRWSEMFLPALSQWEESVERSLTLRRACFLLVAYLGFFFLISIPLQRQTRLSNWETDVPMFVGGDGTARHAWKGQIAKLQVWNRVLSEESARKLAAGEPAPGTESGLLASYDFAGAPPYSDGVKSLPALNWISSSPPHESPILDLNGSSWLRTNVSVTNLTQELRKTNQFTVRAVCTPADTAELEQVIVSISQVYGSPDLSLRRDGADLLFWFRTPLSVHRSFLFLRDRGVFAPGESRDILISNDGSSISYYVDGKKQLRNYHLGPGTALVHAFARVFAFDLEGYLVSYDALIFFPAGVLLGMIARKKPSQSLVGKSLLFLGLVLPSVVYQSILVAVSGKSFFWKETILCLVLTLLGARFINADRGQDVQSRTA
jgi:VanZ family protein